MTADTLFTVFNTAVLPAWFLMIAAPRSGATQFLLRTFWLPFVYAIGYAGLLFWLLLSSGESLDFMSLQGVMALFKSEWGVLVGWIHYLAFDMLAGIWALGDSQRRGVPHGFMVVCLFFTLMFGPFGFGLYWLLRLKYTDSARLVEQREG